MHGVYNGGPAEQFTPPRCWSARVSAPDSAVTGLCNAKGLLRAAAEDGSVGCCGAGIHPPDARTPAPRSSQSETAAATGRARIRATQFGGDLIVCTRVRARRVTQTASRSLPGSTQVSQSRLKPSGNLLPGLVTLAGVGDQRHDPVATTARRSNYPCSPPAPAWSRRSAPRGRVAFGPGVCRTRGKHWARKTCSS